MSAVITIDQVGLLPAGTADEARSDGLATGAVVTLTSADPGATNVFQFLWVPDEDTTSVSSLAHIGATATFSPTVGVEGTWRILLTVDAGLPTESYSIRTFSVRTASKGLRKPAFNERASTYASLLNNGAGIIDQCEANEGGSYTGYYASLMELYDAVENLDTTPGDGSVTLAKLANLAQDTIIGRATASTGVPEAITCTSAGRALLDDANAAAQRTTLGLGSLATASSVATANIDADAVTYAKLQNVSATDKILGRSTAGAGDVEEIDCTAAGRALLDDADAAAQRTTLGLGSLATLSAIPAGSVTAAATDILFAVQSAASTHWTNDPATDTPIFSADRDTFTLAAGQLYIVEAFVHLAHPSAPASTGFNFTMQGGATYTFAGLSFRAHSFITNTAIQAVTQHMAFITDMTTGVLCNSATSHRQRFWYITGSVLVNSGGTAVPSLRMNGVPSGGIPQTQFGTYWRFTPVGTGIQGAA